MLFRYACSMYGFGLIKIKSKDGGGYVGDVDPSEDPTVEQKK
jgi:hypothetical protein